MLRRPLLFNVDLVRVFPFSTHHTKACTLGGARFFHASPGSEMSLLEWLTLPTIDLTEKAPKDSLVQTHSSSSSMDKGKSFKRHCKLSRLSRSKSLRLLLKSKCLWIRPLSIQYRSLKNYFLI